MEAKRVSLCKAVVVFACVFGHALIGLLVSSAKNSVRIASSMTMPDDGRDAPASDASVSEDTFSIAATGDQLKDPGSCRHCASRRRHRGGRDKYEIYLLKIHPLSWGEQPARQIPRFRGDALRSTKLMSERALQSNFGQKRAALTQTCQIESLPVTAVEFARCTR
jgi:hypothetical protein